VQTVLVTGASRGIGRASALRLAASGWEVIAGVRRERDGESLSNSAAAGQIAPVVLDITDDEHLAGLDQRLPSRLDAVVNNAGVVVPGPLEGLPLAELRRQLEVNVVGQMAVTQAVLPRLRAARGRVVFVSSLSGRVSTPMSGAYNASKFALEGMADALRMELAPWGVKVALIEPAQTDTDIWRSAEEDAERATALLDPHHRELYARHIAGYRKTIPRSQRMAAPAEGVAAAIEKALTDRRPRARYVVGGPARAQALLAQLTPSPVLDLLLRTGTGVPRRL
jgi:NAD(P)-dependent dehydrogenase (short-subunit alcohol dehydrogenase family)